MLNGTIEEIWDATLNILKDEVSPVSFDTWIKTMIPTGLNSQGQFVLQTVDSFTKSMVESRHLRLVQNAIREVSQTDYDIVIISQDQMPQEIPAPPGQIIQNEGDAKGNSVTQSNTVNAPVFGMLNPRYVFDTFVVGSGNRMAHAASVAVAEAPAFAYNPLFLYGGVGLGKTHLMHSVAQHILMVNPATKVLYVSSETFTNELINAIKHATNEQFRRKYREIDVLLIDDIQFLSEKESTQEEFFHTFNTLHDANKQIIISSDRPPTSIKTLEERLSSRFKQGLIADIKPPDFETRMAILTKKADRERMHIQNEILVHIAKVVDSNIRELEGALTRVVAYAKLTNTALNLATAEAALNEVYEKDKVKNVTAELIIETVADHYSIPPDEIRGKKRQQSITYPRQIAMYLCRKLLSVSLSKIGDSFGGRDHTTIMHGCEKLASHIEKDPNIKATVEQLENKITG